MHQRERAIEIAMEIERAASFDEAVRIIEQALLVASTNAQAAPVALRQAQTQQNVQAVN
jgi:hypothetical protein